MIDHSLVSQRITNLFKKYDNKIITMDICATLTDELKDLILDFQPKFNWVPKYEPKVTINEDGGFDIFFERREEIMQCNVCKKKALIKIHLDNHYYGYQHLCIDCYAFWIKEPNSFWFALMKWAHDFNKTMGIKKGE